MNKHSRMVVKEIKILKHIFNGTAFEDSSDYAIRKLAKKRLKNNIKLMKLEGLKNNIS